jgi:hypothetical protein
MPELKLGLNDKALFEAQAGKGGGGASASAAKKAVELEVRPRAEGWMRRHPPATPTPPSSSCRVRASPGRAGPRHHMLPPDPFPPTRPTACTALPPAQDIKFHQCVRLTRFESDRTISFIPPDGEFELMSYRLNTAVKPVIWVETVIEMRGRSRVEYSVKARSQFKPRSSANNVEILIPVPPDVDSPAFKASAGSVTYVPDVDAIKWTIKQVRAAYGAAALRVQARLCR